MSVVGEFQRILGEYLAFLEGSDSPGAQACAGSLRRILEAHPIGSGDGRGLEVAAEQVLDVCGGADPAAAVGFRTATERDQFRSHSEHLATLCRAILGRPA